MKLKILTVLVFIGILLAAVLPMSACAVRDKDTATDTLGFDEISSTGCTDDVTYKKSPPESIKLHSGWGKFDGSDVVTTSITFWFMFSESGMKMKLYIEDAEDGSNKIHITIKAYDDETSVEIEDRYNGKTEVKENKERVSSLHGFGEAKIVIQETGIKTDATKKEITVELEGTIVIDRFELLSAEEELELEERKFNTFTFKSQSSANVVYIDDIEITFGETKTKGLSWLPIIGVGGVIGVLGMVKFNVWPFEKKGFIRRRF